jgi:protein O-mannosyl-transferase
MTNALMELEESTKVAAPAKLTTDRVDSMSTIFLFLLAAGCYLNTLMNAFVYDDELQILQNPYVKSWHYLPQIFRTTVWSFIGSAGDTNYYRPLMTLTYLVLWKIFGNSPVGYHLVNILLNALVVTCVYFAGRELFKNQWSGLIAAILFAVHPVHTEAVCWIASVPDLEATLLCLLAFYVYLKNPELGWRRQALVVICFLLSLLAKEPALMLAPLLIYYEHFVRDGRKETTFAVKVKRYLPICVAGVAYIVVRIALLGKLAPVLQRAQVTWPQAVYSAFALITDYTRLLFWPARLSAFHVFHPSYSIGERPVLMGVGIVAISAVLAFWLHKHWPPAAFCIVWMAATLLPVLNARWMASNVLTERYLYLPSVGFCWLIGWAAKSAWDSLDERIPARATIRVAALAVGFVLVSLGAVKTWTRSLVWRDDLTLYSKTLETDPDSHIMHMNLGVTYDTLGDFSAAEKELRIANSLKPDSPNTLNALGYVYLEEGRVGEAGDAFRSAIAAKPQWTNPHFNYGRVLKKLGQDDAAFAEFQKAVELAPVNASARLYLAQELAERGKNSEAEAEYRKSVELSPSLVAQQDLVDLLLKTGKDNSAEELLQKMISEYPYDSTTHLKLGRLLEKSNKIEEAKKEYQAVLISDPVNAEAKDALKRLENPHK